MPHLESLGIILVDFKNPEHILRIEIVNAIAALSLYPASSEGTFKVKRISLG
jgi:tRNA(Ser,Leu) C12 N-acetylase TAN1